MDTEAEKTHRIPAAKVRHHIQQCLQTAYLAVIFVTLVYFFITMKTLHFWSRFEQNIKHIQLCYNWAGSLVDVQC